MQKKTIMDIDEQTLKSAQAREKYTICVIGCGRMGLPTACLFADAGFKVIGVDKNRKIVETINKRKSPIAEPGLEELISKNVKSGKLIATADTRWAVAQSDVILVIVDTPVDEKKNPDYSKLETACKEIGKNLQKGALVIIASTVGPGVTENLVRSWIENASGLKAGNDFGLAYSPTRATAGRTLYDISHYARLIAGIDDKSLKVASLIFETVVKSGVIPLSSLKAAETVKLFQNIYRDVNLALSNEFALFCEKAGIDYMEIHEAANTDPYCHLLIPGVISGHIPKDPYLLLKEAEDLGVKLRIAKLAREVNERMVNHAIRLVRKALKKCGKPLRGAKIAVFGVSYKANVKEPKGSRTLNIVKSLSSKGAKVKVYDPFFSKKELLDLGYPAESSWKTTVRGVDCLIIVVGHNQFKNIKLKSLKTLMKSPSAIVDLSHIINPEEAKKENILLISLGKGKTV
ncbi:nucleotide sugar dehydrogenase [Candidatus Bathyarchaeota archaeon]|nr:MAG: nucleotide sugar dehydrogenase [Candidatus Bathyarchaeota archaeon]